MSIEDTADKICNSFFFFHICFAIICYLYTLFLQLVFLDASTDLTFVTVKQHFMKFNPLLQVLKIFSKIDLAIHCTNLKACPLYLLIKYN